MVARDRLNAKTFDDYRAWVKFVMRAHPKMPARHNSDRLKLYCLAMAKDGGNGLGCYTSNATIAEELEWNRDTVTKYRRLAVALGWFKPNGERHGRAKELDIAIPRDEFRSAPVPHDPLAFPEHCQACLATGELDELGNLPASVQSAHYVGS
jgi:hypothetical protein